MSNKANNTIRIQMVRSGIGSPQKLKLVLKGLGLRKMNQVVEKPDNPGIRGMVAKIPHLVEVLKD
jgi:large subunit ribosomal protein L30